jgi:hypothetical protein
MRGVPRVPTNPVTLTLALFRVWRRLPPAQRRVLLQAARKHGPRIAAGAAAAASARARRRFAGRA